MMFTRYSAGRKYRLIKKLRFSFAVVAVAAFFAALVCAFIFTRNDTGYAADQVKPVNASPAPAKIVSKSTSIKTGDWRLTLVNESHPLPSGFSVETQALPNGLQFDVRAYGDLTAMLQAGKEQGLSFVVCSAYRTVDKQKVLFDEQVATEQATGLTHEKAIETAKTKVAIPGTSEHNLGLAVDIVSLDYQTLDKGYLDTPECKWLQANSYKYGFIMRYPENKSAITKIVFEPWHYRYVGAEAATEITQKGLCLEEYIGMAD